MSPAAGLQTSAFSALTCCNSNLNNRLATAYCCCWLQMAPSLLSPHRHSRVLLALAATATSDPADANAEAPRPTPYEVPFEQGATAFTSPARFELVSTSAGTWMVSITAFYEGQEGDAMVVVGGTRVLGNWEPDAAPKLFSSGDGLWTATLELPPGTHEFKVRQRMGEQWRDG